MSKILTNLPRRAAGLLLAPTLATILSVSTLCALPTQAQETQVAISSAAYGATRAVQVEVNKSMLIDLPAGVAEVIVSQPGVAAAIMRTRTRAILQGIAGGSTNIFFLDDAGRTIQVLDLNVIEPASEYGLALESTLARVIPGSNIKVEALTNKAGTVTAEGTTHFLLTGTVLTGQDKAIAESLANDLSDGDGQTGSLIQVIGPQQVMLQVTVSEVKRDIAKQFGINLSGTLSVGTANFGFNNNVAGTGFTTNGATGNFNFPNLDINAQIKALESRGGLRVLAQPTLTAISGEPAKFLAGGELPYYTYNSNNGTTTTQTSVIFKPYGVELEFTPVVKSGNIIALKVHTSVSDPQTDGSLTRREADTSVELPAGTTLAIGGLLQETARQQINQLPGLGNIPILGALFRSRDFQTEQTELVILVTPYLVMPSPANSIPVPTDATAVASDAESVFLGKLETMYGVGSNGQMRGSISGSVGFVLD